MVGEAIDHEVILLNFNEYILTLSLRQALPFGIRQGKITKGAVWPSLGGERLNILTLYIILVAISVSTCFSVYSIYMFQSIFALKSKLVTINVSSGKDTIFVIAITKD